jgi:hypothetical protein
MNGEQVRNLKGHRRGSLEDTVGEPPTVHDHASATQSAFVADTQALTG